MAQSEGTPTVTVTAVGMTDVGRVREHNEDAFLVMDRDEGRPAQNGEQIECKLESAVIVGVADGMGGAAAGEVASRIAVERLAKDVGEASFENATPDQIVALIDQTLRDANSEIQAQGKDNPELRGMGTTMTAAIVVPGRAYIAHVGDSRGYLMRKGKLVRLTRDQSLIEQLIDEGTITEEEAEKMGGRNIILQALGVEETVHPDTKPFPVLRGDTFMFCSDGLSGMVKDNDIERIVNEASGDLHAAVEELVKAANENGGRDNITCVMARFEGEGLRAPMDEVEQDSVDKVGTRFVAPPPPEVPNPMKKVMGVGVVLLAILAALFFVVQRTTADLVVPLKGMGAPTFELALTPDGGGDGGSTQTISGATATFEKLELGKYKLVVKAKDHYESEHTLDISEAGTIEMHEVYLRPLPCVVVVHSGMPYVRVLLQPKGSGHPDEPLDAVEDRFEHSTAEPLKFENIPPGPVVIRSTREGFADREDSVELTPGQEFVHRLEPLDEVKSDVEISSDEGGFDVRIVDEHGEELARGTTTAGQALALSVRVGTHTLKATKTGFQDVEEEITIKDGEPFTYTVSARPRTVAVAFVCEIAFRDGELQSKDAKGRWVKATTRPVVGEDGMPSRNVDLVPGPYRLKYAIPRHKRFGLIKEFTVPFGKSEITVELPPK